MPAGHHLSTEMSFSGEISNSDCLSEMDLEGGKLHLCDNLKTDQGLRDCRICHLGLENGVAFELGCSCKGDLGSAHKKCAETWFKIKGNTICEICGVTALNVTGEQGNETHSTAAAAAAAAAAADSSAPPATTISVETRSLWHSRRVMNFLLACMVFAFVISWLFHFKILS